MLSKGWIQRLFREINIWVEERIIDPTHAERIKGRYSRELERNRLVSVIFILGSILVGLGIILFIASNWHHLGRPLKVGMVFSLILGFNAIGYYVRFERQNHKLGESLIFLGAVSFGAGIWLIAQIFQIPYNYANGLLFWIIGILPVVFFLRSKIILVLASLLSLVWLSVVIGNNPSSMVYSFFILLAVIAYLTYREEQKASLAISIIAVYIWLGHFHSQLEPVYRSSFYANLFVGFGFMLYCFGKLHYGHKKFSGFSTIYKLFAMAIIFLGNYLMTFSYHDYGYWHKVKNIDYMFPGMLIICMFYLLAVLLSTKCIFRFRSDENNKKEAQIILLLVVLQIIAMLSSLLSKTAIAVTYNILLFSEVLTFIYVGYLLREELIFRLALFGFAIHIFTRYVDTLGAILPRSIFFTVGGLILIVGGIFMEKQRKAIEQRMRENPPGAVK